MIRVECDVMRRFQASRKRRSNELHPPFGGPTTLSQRVLKSLAMGKGSSRLDSGDAPRLSSG